MNKIKSRLSYQLRKFQLESQTWPLQNAPAYIKILAFVYQLIGRKLIAKSLVSSSQCNSCNLCAEVCPNNAIKIRRNNPRRNNHCKGCLQCIYSCPLKVFDLPVISLAGAILLLFLPYDNWIIKLLSHHTVPVMNFAESQVISFILWGIGYAVAVYVFEKSVYLFSTFPMVKKFGEKPIIKKMREKIHPALIFPAIIYTRSNLKNQ